MVADVLVRVKQRAYIEVEADDIEEAETKASNFLLALGNPEFENIYEAPKVFRIEASTPYKLEIVNGPNIFVYVPDDDGGEPLAKAG